MSSLCGFWLTCKVKTDIVHSTVKKGFTLHSSNTGAMGVGVRTLPNIKPLFGTPTCHSAVCQHAPWEAARDGLSAWIPETHMKNCTQLLSLASAWPALTTAGIWGVSQQMKELSLLSFCLLNDQSITHAHTKTGITL